MAKSIQEWKDLFKHYHESANSDVKLPSEEPIILLKTPNKHYKDIPIKLDVTAAIQLFQ
jgi:hypothetical protein